MNVDVFCILYCTYIHCTYCLYSLQCLVSSQDNTSNISLTEIFQQVKYTRMYVCVYYLYIHSDELPYAPSVFNLSTA